MNKQDKRRPRLYFMLVELDTGEKASLLIMKFADAFGAQLTGHNKFVRQVSAKVRNPDFATCDLAELLLYVREGFSQAYGINFDLLIPDEMSSDEWEADRERQANDPRYIVFERPGSKVRHYGINADDLPAMHQEMRLKGLH